MGGRSATTEPGNDILDFRTPSPAELDRVTAPLRLWFAPRFFGLDNIDPTRPAMLVGNHTIYGLFDVPLLLAEIYRTRGILPRLLLDRGHLAVPGWRRIWQRYGAVEGTPDNCNRLMRAGEHVLLFPGGAREAAKRRGEAYKLTWKQRAGFARMAIHHRYDIIPVTSVGPDNAYSIVLDAEDMRKSLMGRMLDRSGLLEGPLRGGDLLMPAARGIGPTPIPRPVPFYFSVGTPISTRRYRGRFRNDATVFALREEVANAINRQFGRLLHFREQDTDSGWLRRFFARL